MNQKLLILLFVFIGFMTSCSQDDVDIQAPEKVVDDVSINDIDYCVVDGVLSFNSSDDFDSLNEKLSQMTNAEVLHWEKANSFKSLNTEVESVFSKLDSCKTYEEYENILNINKDIVCIEDSTQVAVLKSIFYPRIINRDGFFIVGGTLHEVTTDGVFINEDVCFDALNIASVKAELNDDPNIIFIPHQTVSKNLKSTSCGSSMFVRSDRNGDRRCTAGIDVEKVVHANSGYFYYEYQVTIYSHAIIKNMWGNYKEYRSRHHIDYSNFKINVPDYVSYYNGDSNNRPIIHYKPASFTIDTSTIVNPTRELKTVRWNDNVRIGNQIRTHGPANFVDPTFISVKARFYTTGSYPKKAELICN